MTASALRPASALTGRVIPFTPREIPRSVQRLTPDQLARELPASLGETLGAEALPQERDAPWLQGYKAANLPNIMRGLRHVLVALPLGIPTMIGTLRGRVLAPNGMGGLHILRDYGLVSCRLVTNAGVAYLVDALQGTVEPELLRYHGIGTGATAEAASDTTLGAETAAYSTGVRATGTLTEGATANVFKTVGTNLVNAAVAMTEHGIFSADTAGTLLDRSQFAVINLPADGGYESTYELTLAAGS